MPRKPLQKMTIKDIAELCNVSTQTVSRVINRRPDVSPDTREAIERVIAEKGYRPSALARSLVSQRSYTLGVITAGLRYLGVSQTLNGITEQSEAWGYTLLIKELPDFDTPDIVPVIENLMQHQVEGIIFAAPELNDNVKIAQAQLPASCPAIIFLKCRPNPNYTTLNIDNRGGARKATEYLLGIGRRRVGLITGPLEWLESQQRKLGWEDALKASGLPAARHQWAEGQWSAASGEAAFTELLQHYPSMDGVFISNDQMALGALHYASAHDIRVPQDIAIIGFDNLPEAAFFSPALTTLTHPLRELGSLAVKTLVEQVEAGSGAQPRRAITLSTELVLRDSTP